MNSFITAKMSKILLTFMTPFPVVNLSHKILADVIQMSYNSANDLSIFEKVTDADN